MAVLSQSFADGLNRVGPDFTTSLSLPPASYHDADVLAAEHDILFRKGWVGIGRADRWRDGGDFTAIDIGGVPVMVLRDKQGELRAFANSCRHRGAKLLEGCGNVARITCPFHAWTYGLDGALRGAPRMGHSADFDTTANGLIPFRVETRSGFAFLCLDETTPALDDWLGDFKAMHSPWPLASLRTMRRRELEVGCNWKLFLEVFNEYYHLPYVHGGTFGTIYGEPDAADDVEGAFTTQFGLTKGTGGLKEDEQEHSLPAMPKLDGRNRDGTRYTWAFPSMTFAVGTDAMWVYEARPITTDRCHVTMSVCFPEETIAAPGFESKAAHYYERMDDALEEDRGVLERQQAGMTSPFAQQGRFAELEPSVANFAYWYARQMKAA
ncbi:MAG: aromatic ring-hydroxylating dioxygenase subunit alpha [Rhodospirillaceae bacterium]|jgi:phenylpropionate dioxygenase-like ring-hydroxylating dioxygenase large terminal subunit|nr:aromatic ring-hydroxylating dioxygenase subunit alpha [Rhodospirillaceae bacterium]MBT7646825.1 aromatic ring-hydroxylating dioxygenase subunit alpha [Rhodospirillaceae bacterium]